MSTAHELMERLRADGAQRFATTGLAADHTRLTRTVARQRAVRAVGTGAVGVAAAGAAVMAGMQLVGHDAVVNPATLGPTTPTPAASSTTGDVTIVYGERVDNVAGDLADLFGVTTDRALAAITAALPAEAKGSAEGWVAPGEYHFDVGDYTLDDAAAWMVNTQINALTSTGQPRERWHDIIVLASILDKEAPVLADRSSVATVLTNRLDQGMKLQIESPLAYYLHADTQLVGDDGWAVDTPYNTFMYEGLPPTPIGSASRESIAAAADPAPGDWMYFLRKPDGNVLLFAEYADYAKAVDEYFPGTGASD